MTLIVLTSGCYSGYHIVGVFSSREKAEAHAKLHNHNDFTYEEYDVDERVNDQRQTLYTCNIDLNGDLISEQENSDLFPPGWSHQDPIETYEERFRAMSVVSKEHARKLAAELRQSWLREVKNPFFYWSAGGHVSTQEVKLYGARWLMKRPRPSINRDPFDHPLGGGHDDYIRYNSTISAEDAVIRLRQYLATVAEFKKKRSLELAAQ